jgi:hypothetical protein
MIRLNVARKKPPRQERKVSVHSHEINDISIPCDFESLSNEIFSLEEGIKRECRDALDQRFDQLLNRSLMCFTLKDKSLIVRLLHDSNEDCVDSRLKPFLKTYSFHTLRQEHGIEMNQENIHDVLSAMEPINFINFDSAKEGSLLGQIPECVITYELKKYR